MWGEGFGTLRSKHSKVSLASFFTLPLAGSWKRASPRRSQGHTGGSGIMCWPFELPLRLCFSTGETQAYYCRKLSSGIKIIFITLCGPSDREVESDLKVATIENINLSIQLKLIEPLNIQGIGLSAAGKNKEFPNGACILESECGAEE